MSVAISIPDSSKTLLTTIDEKTNKHVIYCDLCGVKVLLTSNGNAANYYEHRGRGKCLKEQKRRDKENGTVISSSRHVLANRQDILLEPLEKPTIVRSSRCSGISVNWTVGSIYSTYPYRTHEYRDLGWVPRAFYQEQNKLRLQASVCEGIYDAESDYTCPRCLALPTSHKYQTVVERAYDAKPHTPYAYLHALQVEELLSKARKTNMSLRDDNRSLKRQLQFSKSKNNDYQRILILMSQKNIPGLQRLLEGALRRGVSPGMICQQIAKAASGLYRVRGNWSDREMDIAFLVKSLGGPKLLFALSKAHGYPSARTVGRTYPIPRILPSIAEPTEDEIKTNISAFFNPKIKSPPSASNEHTQLPGHILMFDGVAIEPKCRYCPRRNKVIGLCREHAGHLDLEVSNMESVEKIRDALNAKTVCFGQDATVVALAPYVNEDHYCPMPLVLSASDKTEKSEQLTRWIGRTITVYKEHTMGERLHGPIWAIASDGDSTFRKTKHEICMKVKINSESDLGKILDSISGLNTHTSVDGIISTCDPKHVFKRFASSVRSSGGLMVDDCHIKPSHVLENLCLLDGMTEKRAIELLDPADKQNVPKAVQLFQELVKIEKITSDSKSLSPSQIRHSRALLFMAKMISYFIKPFIDVSFSLSQQIASLSAYAHLAVYVYMKHGTACIKGALYADSQAIIKNIIITVAKLQLIDPHLSFYIILEGTDRLEMVFSDARTQDHARNFDVDQLGTKISIGTGIHIVFERNPDLDRGHRRLNLTNALGVDHINPKSWKGNVCVGDVDLKAQWLNGQSMALKLLEEFFPDDDPFDFDALFAKSDCDILRPRGVYVGVSENAEDVEVDSLDKDHATQTGVTWAGNDHSNEHDDMGMGVGVDIEDYFPDTLGDNVQSETLSKTIDFDGKKFLKASVVASLCSDKKVTVRTLRARGVTLQDLQGRSKLFENDNDDGRDFLKSNDPAAGLVYCGGKLCLVIFEIQSFKGGNSVLTSITYEEFEKQEASIIVAGQMLELHPLDNDAETWEWTGCYLPVDEKPNSDIKTIYRFAVDFPALLVFPLAAKVGESQINTKQGVTWQFSSQQLKEIFRSAEDDFKNSSENSLDRLNLIPRVNNSTSIPYRLDGDENFSTVIQDIPEARKGKDLVECLICQEKLQLYMMRNHVGMHILRVERTLEGNIAIKANVGIDPCGFCGKDGCITQLSVKKKGKIALTSNCRYRYEGLKYEEASKGTVKTPCTNVPIDCIFCPKTVLGQFRSIWKYNAIKHLIYAHSDENGPPSIPGKMLVDLFVTKQEEEALGITGEKTKAWRDEYDIPNSDDIAKIDDETGPDKHKETDKEKTRSGRASWTQKRVRRDTLPSSAKRARLQDKTWS